MKMKFGIYRTYGQTFDRLNAVRRNGGPVQFRTKSQARKWLKANPPKSKFESCRYEVRRIIKFFEPKEIV